MSQDSRLSETVSEIAAHLVPGAVGRIGQFASDRRSLEAWISHRFVKLSKKAKVWGTPALLGALKNLEYGFDPSRARSRGGRDGIFLLDRGHRPENEMMRKVFDRFLDKGHEELEAWRDLIGLGTSPLQAVRVVGHHLRVLGVMGAMPATDVILLVDVDVGD